MKHLLIIAFILLGCMPGARADHITGGEVYYTFAGITGGQYKYSVTVKLFMLCSSDRELNDPAIFSIFNPSTGARIEDFSVPLNNIERRELGTANPCVTNPPPVCFLIGYYHFDVSLPASPDGYLITAQVVFRVDGMNNLFTGYNQVGATYTAFIPSTNSLADAPENNSARFTGNDLVVICAENAFSYSFAATDEDGDELRYSFCNAYQTTNASPNDGTAPPPPPYQSVPYGNGYTGGTPLGNNVSINSTTGLIKGIAPSTGTYVITVCVDEIRNGVVIATQRKDFQINIASCDIAAASLLPEYMLCKDSKTFNARNLSTSPLINTYSWDILDENGNNIFSSGTSSVTHTFTDTGNYIVKLIINKDEQCADSATADVKVFPGFIPAFNITGTCISRPVQFTDVSTTVYGTVNAWNWDFGEVTASNDISSIKNPVYNYTTTGNKNVRLIAENSVGCKDTLFKIVEITDKPPIQLSFRDTLICPPDALQLNAQGSGNFSWSPQVNIINENTNAPVVSPASTIVYYVKLDNDGCINNDSVMVRVVNQVSLQTMPDTVICQGDSFQLRLVSDGLRFLWTPAAYVNDPSVMNPVATPSSTITYQVTASISTCTTTGNVEATTIPYPLANAGPDTLICFNTTAPLNAEMNGTSFFWKPDPTLQQTDILNPVARPITSTEYIFYAFDTKGCPKPGIDTVNVTVLPEVIASAGRDTNVVWGQPLQLQATGGTIYSWSPATALSATDIANPTALFSATLAGYVFPYKVVVLDEAGCTDSAFIQVRVFSTLPDIFVPSAFTPNGDGRNDFFEPVAAGIAAFDIFRIYNRWGQLVYSSTNAHRNGWDGTFKGEPQPSGSFVWMLKATDYTGKTIMKKGTVILIR